MSMNEFQRQTLDCVKELIVENNSLTDQKIDRIEKLAGNTAEQVGNLIVGGSGSSASGIDREEHEKDARAFFGAVLRREPNDSEVDHSALQEYSAAFGSWLRRGENAISSGYQAAMRIGSSPDGGYLAPPEFSRSILQRLYDSSPIRQVATVMSTSASALELPLDTSDLTSGGWIGETESRPETTSPTVGLQTLHMREQYAQPAVTQRLLDMADFPVEEWLTDKIADKLTRDENTAFVSGAGTDRPRGFLSYKDTATTDDDADRDWGILQKVTTGASGSFPAVSGSTADDAGSLIDLQHKLKPAYLPGAVWLMSRSTAAVVRKLKDADGRFLWQDNLHEGGRPLLLGHAVVLADDFPSVAANSYSIAFGNMQAAYLILDHRAGLRLLRDPYTSKGNVRFYATKYVAADVRDFDALKILQFAS